MNIMGKFVPFPLPQVGEGREQRGGFANINQSVK